MALPLAPINCPGVTIRTDKPERTLSALDAAEAAEAERFLGVLFPFLATGRPRALFFLGCGFRCICSCETAHRGALCFGPLKAGPHQS